MNGNKIFDQYEVDTQRKVLFDPNFAWIHLPLDDFEQLSQVIIDSHMGTEAIGYYKCGEFNAGQKGCYY